MKAYFVANFCAFFFFVILFVENNAGQNEDQKPKNEEDGQSSSLGTMGFIVTGVSLALVITSGLIYPLVKLKIAPMMTTKKVPPWLKAKVPGFGEGHSRKFQAGTSSTSQQAD